MSTRRDGSWYSGTAGYFVQRRERAQRRRRARSVVEREPTCGLMQESLAMFQSSLLSGIASTPGSGAGGVPVFGARARNAGSRAEPKSVELQRSSVVRGNAPDRRQRGTAEIVPELSSRRAYSPRASTHDDAVVFLPWPFVWGYAERRARARRVDMRHVHVAWSKPSSSRVDAVSRSVLTERGPRAHAESSSMLAARFSPELAAYASTSSLPTKPHRREICAERAARPSALAVWSRISSDGSLLLPVDSR